MRKLLAILLIAALLLAGCATFVRIDSNAPAAKVMVNGEFIGNTPAQTTLSNFDFTTYDVVISAEGYRTFYGQLYKELKVGAFVAGWFFLLPWLWSYGPRPYQAFDLEKQ